MQIIETKGNHELMCREKTLFLCSKRTPINLYEYVFRWVDSLTEKECIVGFIRKEAFSDPDSHASRAKPLSPLRIGQNDTLVTSQVV